MEIDFARDLKEIFDRYEEEKQKPLKGNEFANKMRHEFNEDFMNFALEFTSNEYEYISKISVGSGEWVKEPWAGIRCTKITDTFQDGFYFYSDFDLKEKIYNIGLSLGTENVSRNKRDNRFDFLKKKIEEKFPEIFNQIKFYDYNLIFESFNYDQLSNEKLKEVFKSLLKIYEDLLPDFYKFLENEPPLKSDIRPKNDNVRIWRIASGYSSISKEAWEEFKKGSYIGISFDYSGEEIDYSSFKNRWALDKYLMEYDIKAPSRTMVWKFAKWIRRGDIIIVNSGYDKFAGIGVVIGDFIPPKENENKNDYGLNSIYPVKWIHTPDDLEISYRFFARHAVVEWDDEKWDKFLCAVSRNNPRLKEKILKNLYDEYYKLLQENDVKEHLERYEKESEEINKAWNEIVEKYNNGQPIHQDVWEKILNRQIRVHKDGVSNVKSALKSQMGLSDEDLENMANLLFETLLKLKGNEDEEDQRRIIKEYVENKYSKGLGIGRFSSILYYLDNQYYVINKKTIETVKLLSLILGDEIIISKSLSDYVDENKRYHEFLDKLRNAYLYDKVDVSDFLVFDPLCHYICSESPINYIGKNAVRIPIEYYVNTNETFYGKDISLEEDLEEEANDVESDDSFENKTELLYLNPDSLESKLQSFKISENIINQLCASLNAGKNIILDGTPGTGKTELAKKFATAASDNNFIDGYVLTTATSDWSTFDTIGGLMPNEKGELFFYRGKFLDAIAENKWLIIDEINRADIDKAFGQLFTVLSKQDVELPYKENNKPIQIKLWEENDSTHDEENAIYYIGKNWRIIGTMNVDDKDSLFDLSYAFMRRFMFIEVDLPEESDYKDLIKMWANDLSDEYTNNLLRVYDVIKFRKLGPAIFKDMTEYIKFRDEISDDSTDLILAEAISSYIVPQFEGLNRNKVEQIRKLIGDIGLSSYLDEELKGLIPKF